MKSLRIDFQGDAPKLAFDRPAHGLENSIQNALVNIGTRFGDHNLHSKRGTRLLASGVRGLITSQQTAQHQANFAAIETTRFLEAVTEVELPDTDTISKISLIPKDLNVEGGRVTLQASFTSNAGEQIGIISTL